MHAFGRRELVHVPQMFLEQRLNIRACRVVDLDAHGGPEEWSGGTAPKTELDVS